MNPLRDFSQGNGAKGYWLSQEASLEVGAAYRHRDWQYEYPRHLRHFQSNSVVFDSSPRPDFSRVDSAETCRSLAASCQTHQSSVPVAAAEAASVHWQNMRRQLQARWAKAKMQDDQPLLSRLCQESRDLQLSLDECCLQP
ncbi:MAG: hypothetical protein AAGG02_16835 [Cyanobacteria bacterium P01_H01_bin.15]